MQAQKQYKFHLFVLLGLILLNLAFFAFNLNDFFVSDDFDWLTISKNTEHSLTDYFGTNYYGNRGAGGSYRPLVNLVFWLNYQIGGLNPLSYHLTNLIFQIGVCFLVYLLVLVLFSEFPEKKRLAILSALFFSILPNHSEAVIWIAAVSDPMAAFFYLLAFYFYILFRKKAKFYFLLISATGFILALLTKEIAMTLPLLILVWELYEAINKNKFSWRNIILKPLGYWLILTLYFIARYASIGLFFGYYAQEKIKIHLGLIFKMFASLVTDLFFYGKMRVVLIDYFCANKLFFVFLLILILTLAWYALRNYQPLADKFKVLFLFDAYFVLILPVLLLNFNNLTDEGERYNYLPSVVFCILLSLLIVQIKKDRFLKMIILGSLLLYFSAFLITKNENWHQASLISQKAVLNDFKQAVDLTKQNQKLLFVGLPDNFEGVPVLRNGIKLAINLYYPDYKFTGEVLNAYLRLTRQNWDQQILKWADYPTGGYLAKTIDGRYWVTGFDRRETETYIFENWHYNYANYTADTIRLILKGDYEKALAENNLQILIFDQGQLKSLNK
ncbi:MAG: hypothetical protein WC460_01260 [Patescibacteria group bacterium]